MRTASSDIRVPALVALAMAGCLFVSVGARRDDDSPAGGRVAPGRSKSDGDGKPALTNRGDAVKTKTPDVAASKVQVPVTGNPSKAQGTVRVAKGFKLDMLYLVPRRTQGSWVALCVDPKGRLIAADQNGKLYRMTLPALGSSAAIEPEAIGVNLAGAHGLLVRLQQPLRDGERAGHAWLLSRPGRRRRRPL